VVAGGVAGAPVETWTVLFTDQIGSTEMRVRVGEEAFDGIRGDLDTRVAAALTAHGVVVTKPTGDGVMGGFTSTVAALRCAVAIQQAVAERNRTASESVAGAERVALRIGISVGDAVVENGDLQGTAVVEAARLCAVASGGTILCSEAVRVVSANRSACSFGPVRPVQLKGLPGPVQVHEVSWAPLPYDPGEHRLAFRVLGPLEVLDGDRRVVIGGPKERLVLGLLLARVNSPVSVDALMDAVWGDRPPRTAERTVHAYVARVRRTLEPRRPRGEPSTVLATVGRGYQLRLDATQLDATRFGDLAKRGSDQLARGDDAASSTLRQALGLWRGEAFGEFREVEACVAEGRRLEELRLGLVEDRVDADLAAGQSTELVGEIEALLREEPFRERLWGQLMLALYRSGRQRDALEAYQRARTLLADELGIEPGPDLRRLEAAVLAQDPSLDVLRPVPTTTVPGGLPAALAAVGPAFLGRESEVAWLREAWADAVDGRGGLVSVLGPEGIGKTRLVAELARDVHDDGAAVLYGRCDHAHRGSRALLGQALQSAGSSLGHIDGGAGDAGDIAEAVARHLPAWSQDRPVLVVLDDLHLADAETLEVVADLAGWCRAAPMLVIATFRSDAVHPSTPAGPPGSKASQLALGPLPSDAVGHICELYATEPWSADDVDRVYELTGGVPLLVHEQASEWARERAGRRMAEATDRGAASRRRLLASRGEVADGVEGIQRLLEQRRAQLAGREAQLQATAVAALAGCPYKGLARFEESDAANFFGRERLVADLVARLAETRILAVVGPSGSGKSSLIRAGLLPALATGVLPGAQPWRSAVLCPGTRPARELAHKLHEAGGPAGGPRVVFVDQFEETFTAGAVRHEQEEVVARLLDVADQPESAVVLAVRADHLDRCAAFPELVDRLDGNDVLVGPMRDSELRRTVELPAQRAGLEIEGGLVEVIVSEVAGRAGALPLLSTALAETWERREGRVLTLAGYRAAGGVNGALARMAEDAYAGLPAGPRGAARRLLLRLCDSGEQGDLTLRRRLPLDEAIDEDDTDARPALETLADRRLLTIDSDSVEVAHEALLREWPRLRTWLDEDVQGRRLHRRLHDAARSWDAAGHDPSELYRGTRLGAATDWAAHHDDELSQTERAFLDTSQAQSDQELADARRQATARARSNRRLRTLLAGIGVLLVVALVVSLVAVGQRDRAQRAGRVATARELAAAANANLEVDPERSILLALKGVERSRSGDGRALPEAEEALHNAVNASHIELRVPGIGGQVDWSPDGTVFVTEGPEDGGIVDIRDAETGETVRSFRGHDGDVVDVAFNHDGTLLATTGDDGAARIWRTATGDELRTVRMPLTNETWGAVGPSFSPDGSLFAAAWPGEGLVTVIDLASGRIVREISSVRSPNTTTFDPAGARLLITSYEVPTTIVDLASGDEAFTLEEHLLYPIMDAAWSPDGESIATAGFDGGVRVFDSGTGQQLFSIHGTGGHVFGVDWAPDSVRLVAGKSDGTARVWIVDEEGAREVITLSAHDTRKGIEGVAFSPDGTRVLTGDLGVTAARVWDVGINGDAEVANLPAVGATAGAVDFTSDGRQLVASSGAGSVTVWDAQSFTRRRTLGVPSRSPTAAAPAADPGYYSPPPSGADVFSVDVSPDGRLVAVARLDGSVRVWDMETGRDAFTVDAGPLAGPYGTVSWSPDGDLLAIAANDGRTGRATVVDRSGTVVAVRQEVFGIALMGLTFTPDSAGLVTARLATGPTSPDASGVVRWDWRKGAVAAIIDTSANLALSSPTGRVVATAGSLRTLVGSAGPAKIWDPATGRRLATLAGNTGAVLDLAFSPDETRLAVSGQDGIVGIWDPTSGEQLLTLRGHYTSVFSVAFSPDGSRLASLGTEGVVRVWTLDLDELIEIAQRELTRTLTDGECQQYLHVDRCPQS
jgi:WD40 repeat protein/DNA-binding SARP family transcriptional activator/class 3 adenylate cyclase/energy-coupling factor transporter ATP-binding protein EcfA2